jgi:hypothetical protein
MVTTVDTVISIFKGSNCDEMTCVDTSDDFCGTSSSLSLLAQKGFNYYIYVAEKNVAKIDTPTSTSDFVLTIDYENNGGCDTSIGPLFPSPEATAVIAGSLRASESQSMLMSCDSNIARGGNVWYSVSAF